MPKKISRVLVVYKKSAYQLHVLERKDRRLLALLRKRHPALVDMRQAHAVHEATLHTLTDLLKQLSVRYDLIYRAQLKTTRGYALAISVGGDGTFLQVSHFIEDHPRLLGINSDPLRSEAVFCAASRRSISQMLRRALSGALEERVLSRLQLSVNGRRLRPLALNDVLIAHSDPATMSRYRLTVGRIWEDQKSSGLWIATAAGSSSAILAAGGRRLPWTSKAFQYRPRELYEGRLARPHLAGGVLSQRKTVEITWLMREGAIFIDGPHVRVPLQFGDRVRVGLSPVHPLRVLGLLAEDARRMTPDSRK